MFYYSPKKILLYFMYIHLFVTCRGRQMKDFVNDDIALFCLHLNCYQQIKLIQKILMKIILFNGLFFSLLI